MGWWIRWWAMCIVHDSPLLSLLCICSIPREELSSIQRVRRVSYAAFSYLVICSQRHASLRPVWPTLLTHLHPPTTDMNKKKGYKYTVVVPYQRGQASCDSTFFRSAIWASKVVILAWLPWSLARR